ncbi:MAG: hypothetical protein EBY80_12235, partial [Actinobacteria bacterium]|nr:hypothetical protein [Actinomycetota bacterium]
MTDTLPLPHDAARNSNAAPKPRKVEGLSGRHEDLHEMISFEDPTEQRTWMIDATFMRSSWKCIFGEG